MRRKPLLVEPVGKFLVTRAIGSALEDVDNSWPVLRMNCRRLRGCRDVVPKWHLAVRETELDAVGMPALRLLRELSREVLGESRVLGEHQLALGRADVHRLLCRDQLDAGATQQLFGFESDASVARPTVHHVGQDSLEVPRLGVG
ncbi:MAG: hypothetical protein O3A10_16210 [Chloroflexi bacterium]|nr:hypothetical protein [Chloroflexota bacterium]